MKKAVVLVRTCPYGMASAGEGYRSISALAGLEIATTAVLVDDGVFVALTGQNPSAIAMSSIEQAYGMLSEFGAKVVIHRESVEARSIPPEKLMDFPLVGDDDVRSLLGEADVVLSF
jgi:tRNA 2-thiouridine synthesizing protein C